MGFLCQLLTKNIIGHELWNVSNFGRNIRFYISCCYAFYELYHKTSLQKILKLFVFNLLHQEILYCELWQVKRVSYQVFIFIRFFSRARIPGLQHAVANFNPNEANSTWKSTKNWCSERGRKTCSSKSPHKGGSTVGRGGQGGGLGVVVQNILKF